MKVKKDFRRLAARMDTVPGNIADMFGFSPASTEMLLRKRGQLRDGESVKDAVRRLYGRATAKLCDRLIGVCPFIIEEEDKDGRRR